MALEVLIYATQDELTKSWLAVPGATVVVPDPQRADWWRQRWGKLGLAVKTINEWQRAEASRLLGPHQKASSKAQIMLYLGRAFRESWQRAWLPRDAVEGLDFHWFNQAYTMLSDLRSFTLDFSLLADLWPWHPQLAPAVVLLQEYLAVGPVWDEHQLYAQLTQKYHDLSTPPPLTKTVVFWGFAHLSAMQIDYLKALAEKVNVIIPYPAKAWQSSLPSDWIRWATPHGPQEVPTTFTLPAQGDYNLVSFPPGRLAATMANFKFKRPSDLYLLANDLTWPQQEIAQANVTAKISLDLWHPLIESWWQELQQLRHQQGRYNSALQDFELSLTDIESFLKTKGQKIMQRAAHGDLSAGRWFKLWSLLTQIVEHSQSLSKQHFGVAGFELALWRKVLYQMVPRVYGQRPAGHDAITVFDLNALPFYDGQKENVVVASAAFGRWRPLGEKYREEELAVLTSLGPIFRAEVAYQAQLQSLGEILQGPATLLVEENLLKQEAGLHEIVSQMRPQAESAMVAKEY
ncbi:MAG: hypothetical protein J6Y94_07690, partial [Bacteriovoracaceae bacterium]|nr:hypothetical protein [Bacteriovoracaceae bacterium]